ncbi:hypothetical protein MVEN_01381400 [Mycena venus]|uniref:Uncharacterized protein n=1 Tax=Mycena venus TaxID=2733690 RepID=A0A8H6XYE5_9AGAR|nr:hypothetical protein MVEN_01381400 [Mycena venus]
MDAVYNELNPPAPVLLSYPPDPYASGKSAPGANKGAKHPQAQATKRPAMPESTRSKTDEQDLESVFNRWARSRIAVFGALRYLLLLETTPTLPLPPFLTSPALWSALQHSQDSSASFYDRIAERVPDADPEEDEDAYTTYLKSQIAAPPIAPRSAGEEGDDADTDADSDTLPPEPYAARAPEGRVGGGGYSVGACWGISALGIQIQR